MINKLKRAAAVIAAVAFIAGIVACSIKPVTVETPEQEKDNYQEEVTAEEQESVPAPPDNYDIAAGLKLKEKDGVKTLKTDHFTLVLTHGDSWDVKVNSKNSITIYNKALNKAKRGGKLVTILAFKAGDKSYDVLPDYNVIGESGGVVYIASYPTDVQFDESDKKSTADYMAIFEDIGKLAEENEGNPMVLREEGV